MTYDDTLYTTDLIELIQLVDAWEIPEEDFAQAVNDQARLMTGLDGNPFWNAPENPYQPLRF